MAKQEFDNNLRGVLFKNQDKEKDTQPDYKGSCEVEGVEMWINAWIKEGKNGKFMSLSFKLKEEAKQTVKKTSAPTRLQDMDDDLPPF